DSIRATIDSSPARDVSPPASEARTPAAPALSASTTAGPPNRDSSARTAGPRRSWSIEGISRKSAIAEMLCYWLLQPRHLVDDFGSAQIPTGRAFLAVCRAAGAAHRGGACLARSGSARGAVRRPTEAVLDHAGIPGARSARLPRSPGDRAGVGRVPRDRGRHHVPPPR